MSSRDVGQRVFAVSHADDEKIYVFGKGVYVGDLPRPGAMPPEFRSAIEAQICAEDAKPVEEHWKVTMYDHFAAQGIKATSSREEIVAEVEAERATDFETRVQKGWESIQKNPCIHLDNGTIVWGCQCWWGPEEAYETTVSGREVVPVPAPVTNGRWKDIDMGDMDFEIVERVATQLEGEQP